MKKLLSLTLALAMCFSLTLSACAVETEEAAAPNSTESTVDTSVSSGNEAINSVDTFANSAGDTEIKESFGTITLSNPILYTISTSDLGKIDTSSAELTIEDLPYDENSFGYPASEYISRWWSDISAVYAVPEGTTVTFPSGIVTATVFELDLTVENGACRADNMEVFLFPGYDTLPLNGNGFILTIKLDYTEVPENIRVTPGGSGGSGSAIGDSDAGTIAFYVPEDASAGNPFGSSAPVTPASPTKFTDVSASSPFVDAINWAVEKNITTGRTDTTFAPGEECTNGQILTFLWRANGSPEPAVDNPFTDSIPASFQKAAVWAYEKGLVSGAVFGASTPCTRAVTVEYLWKAAGSPAVSRNASFTDLPANADYAQAVAWAVENGVTSGTGDGSTFSPNTTCTRGQIVTFLFRAFK